MDVLFSKWVQLNCLQFTLNPKLRGSDRYVKNYKINIPNGKLFWEEPKFIGNIYHEKIDFEPYLLDIELFASSKINDLIIDSGPLTKKLIISGKLKEILEKHRKSGLQFFNIHVIQKSSVYIDFWILNFHEVDMEYVDFRKSISVVRKRNENGETFIEKIETNSQLDFYEKLQNKNGYVQTYIEKIKIKDNILEDFFVLNHVEGGVKYIVSEKLKNKIEVGGCLGVEFMPIEMKMTDWLQGGEREKIYGKS